MLGQRPDRFYRLKTNYLLFSVQDSGKGCQGYQGGYESLPDGGNAGVERGRSVVSPRSAGINSNKNKPKSC